MSTSTLPTLQIKIMSPDEVVWVGEAISISSENSTGSFDILPGHAHFVTLANQNAPVTVRTKEKEAKEFFYTTTILAVRDDIVSIYVDI